MALEVENLPFEKLARLPKVVRFLLVLIMAGVVVGGYAYFLYMPAKERIEALQVQEKDLQRKLAQARAVVQNMPKFKEELEVLEGELTYALRQLPDEEQLYVLLNDIDARGKNAGLEFKAFRRQSKVQRDFYAEVPIELELTGSFHDVVTFFDEISRLDRIVNVNELHVKIERESMAGTKLEVKGRATTYQFTKPAAPKEEARVARSDEGVV